ncbi:MAG: Rid family hydrolase [Acidobacteriota bacterium]|nr:Rid family hydrolase [Acidobacteriota bacterium]
MWRLNSIVASAWLLTCSQVTAAELTRFPIGGSGIPSAIRVGRAGLAHTGMIVGAEAGQGASGISRIAAQVEAIARHYGSTLADVAKLNLYVAEPQPGLIRRIETEIEQAWSREACPALTLIPSPIPGGASVAADAVIAVPMNDGAVTRFGNKASVMPPGRDILYVSGRVGSGALAEATTETMRQLFDVLAHLGSTRADVVQVKAFIQPMSHWETVQLEIDRAFGNVSSPPVVYVAWTSPSRATEIELIAAAPDRQKKEMTVSYITPPGDQASPVYSRVARVHAGELIYIGGIVASLVDTPESEVRSVLDELKRVAEAAGSNLNHLAKATYYVSGRPASQMLNQLRPEYYQPTRPPAASKISVATIGIPDRTLLVDMVAVPAGQ